MHIMTRITIEDFCVSSSQILQSNNYVNITELISITTQPE